MNHVVLAGNLGQDPEIRHSQNGTAFANLSIATSSWVKGAAETQWHRVTVMGKAAEQCGRFKKGMRVGVAGELKYRKWDKDGVSMTSAEIVTFSFVEWLGGDKPESSSNEQKASNAQGGDPWKNEKAHAQTPGLDDVPF